MVCPRCVESVTSTLESLQIPFENVEIGEVELSREIDKSQVEALRLQLKDSGFELVRHKVDELVHLIKISLLGYLELLKSGETPKSRSDFLEEKLKRNYNYLSTVFSELEGKTIEHYWIHIRLDYAKELLLTTENSVTQVSLELGFSSPQNFATHFKKQTGKTPIEFRKGKNKVRSGLLQ
jgi:AraC family transcriptional regulator